MGDVHPHAPKARLARELSRATFERWFKPESDDEERPRTVGKTVFCNSGSEAVEAALKTAMLATGRRGVVAFEGGYHGLGYGALNATHREMFRRPFSAQLGGFGFFAPFPASVRDLPEVERCIRRHFNQKPVGAILAEPIQGRGGMRPPPEGFLPLLRGIADEYGATLIFDEIHTGFGRTGKWFACEHFGTVPDVVCVGKALTGGFPLSACVGRGDLMDKAWPASTGEAIHTSTHLGHPVGCAMALAQLKEIRRLRLPSAAAQKGRQLLGLLTPLPLPVPGYHFEARGAGLFVGLEITRADGTPAAEECTEICKRMLEAGHILLSDGADANVLAFTPPLTIPEERLREAVDALHGITIEILTS